MILLLDIGNTRIKWGWWRDGQLLQGGAAVHQDANLELLWPQCWPDASRPQRVVASAVTPAALTEALSQWAQRHWGVAIEFVRSSARVCGVVNGYRNPEQLGVDRWCAMLGARALVAGPLCVVDCGTAITIDIVQADGHHDGGWIGPGLAMMHAALLRGTAGVRPEQVSGDANAQHFGQATAAAVAAGIRQMGAGMVRQALDLLEQSSGMPPHCVITGGDAGELMALLPAYCRHDPDLVLKGLALLVQQG